MQSTFCLEPLEDLVLIFFRENKRKRSFFLILMHSFVKTEEFLSSGD